MVKDEDLQSSKKVSEKQRLSSPKDYFWGN
jgi:hypothetical protein